MNTPSSTINRLFAMDKWLHYLRPVIAALFFGLATRLMLSDPYFGKYQIAWQQSTALVGFSLLVAMSITFEWKLLGLPRGAMLAPQLLFAVPLGTLFARVIGKETLYKESSNLSLLETATGWIVEKIPFFLSGLFLNLYIMLGVVAFFVLCEFARTKPARIVGLIMLLLMPISGTLASEPIPTFKFFAGFAFLLAGAMICHDDVSQYYRDKMVLRRMAMIDDQTERRVVHKVLERTREDGQISESTLLGIAGRCYSDTTPQQVDAIARTISHDLVMVHGLLEVKRSSSGTFLVLPPWAKNTIDASASAVAIPRRLAFMALAAVWLISPIDPAPDFLPMGALDDVAVGILAAHGLKGIQRRPRMPAGQQMVPVE
jgi:hypothetical protein